ncbi:MAG TPA: hypothetical protein PK794_10095, partial [Armatimonadota bacterium]|nr:hypothetical protein [Armatimonadota bacterium]
MVLLMLLGALAVAQQSAPPASVTRVVVLENLEVAALQPLLGMPLFTNAGRGGAFPYSPMADLVPKEIDNLLGL